MAAAHFETSEWARGRHIALEHGGNSETFKEKGSMPISMTMAVEEKLSLDGCDYNSVGLLRLRCDCGR